MSHDKVRMKRIYGKSLFEVHQAIISAIEEIMKREDTSCVLINEIRKLTHRDSRTIWIHLKLMEMDKYGHFACNGKLFQFDGGSRI